MLHSRHGWSFGTCNAALLLAEGKLKNPKGRGKGAAPPLLGDVGGLVLLAMPPTGVSKMSGRSTLTPHGLRGVSAVTHTLWVTHTPFDLPAPVAKSQRAVCLKQIIEFPHQEGPLASTDEWPPSRGMENSLPAKP